jgi:S1-C subfamily serine protease
MAVVSAQGLWFESYRDALTAWQQEDWARAETLLKDALAKRPEQGRNVPVPGRPGITYLPEYYLGLVYVKQRRFQQALDLLQKVQQTKLVEQRHAEFRDLQAALDECRRGNLASLKARTVKIDAIHAGDEPETGTGIIVSIGKEGLYIVTALHVLATNGAVVEAPRSIRVSFFGGDDRPLAGPVAGEWLDRFDAALDMAAIRVKALPPSAAPPDSTWEYRQTPLEKQERIFTVGHAVEDYTANDTNVVLNPVDRDSRRFVISAAGIGERASGGPVIDSRGYLAGMMVLLLPGSGGASAVRASEIVRMAKIWRIDVLSRPAVP